MLTVLIVEKDEEQLERILGLVNWGVYGFKVIGHCSDGITASRSLLQAEPPSLPPCLYVPA
jgi:YesN/AraC family two-component response regulator